MTVDVSQCVTLSINLQIELEKVSGRRRLRDHLALETSAVSGLNDSPKVIWPGKIKAGTYAQLYFQIQLSFNCIHMARYLFSSQYMQNMLC